MQIEIRLPFRPCELVARFDLASAPDESTKHAVQISTLRSSDRDRRLAAILVRDLWQASGRKTIMDRATRLFFFLFCFAALRAKRTRDNQPSHRLTGADKKKGGQKRERAALHVSGHKDTHTCTHAHACQMPLRVWALPMGLRLKLKSSRA